MKNVSTRPTAVEARNFAAAATLFRVCNKLNLHTMMPPQYRDLWKGQFTEMKKLDTECGYCWMYELEPFTAHRRQSEQQELDKKHTSTNMTNSQKRNYSHQGLKQLVDSGEKHTKGWSNAPRIELGKVARQDIEKLVRRSDIWNPQNLSAPPNIKTHLVEKLTRSGFCRSHAEEAIDICQNFTEALEWLNINVPENDLPSWCLPDAYGAGISKASDDPKKDMIVGKLSAAGFAPQVCATFYDECDGDELAVASRLQDMLLYGYDAKSEDAKTDKSKERVSDYGVWKSEIDVISAIYGDQCQVLSEQEIQVTISSEAVRSEITVCVRMPRGPYPCIPPILTVHAPLPAYIRLNIAKKALIYSIEHLIGSQMIFNIIDWIQEKAEYMISNPGRLSDLFPQMSFRIDRRQVAFNGEASGEAINTGKVREATHQDQHLRINSRSRLGSSEYQKFQRMRESLPAWKMRRSIIQAVDQNQVVLVSGETGSGKSTQSVQYILDNMIENNMDSFANIVCTQPRRISAIALAERVAQERCSKVGEEVGFAIRGERKLRKGITRIVYMTTGVLLRKIQATQKFQDFDLGFAGKTSHIFVDEVHERSVETDFLLLILKDLLQRDKNLKVILMSATADTDLFEKYFSSVCLVGKIGIEGRTHPVQDLYLEDVLLKTTFRSANTGAFDEKLNESTSRQIGRIIGMNGSRIDYGLIGDLVRFINSDLGDEDGSILLFLPGIMEIDRMIRVRECISLIFHSAANIPSY